MDITKYYDYINSIYKDCNNLNREKYIKQTKTKDFVPVIDRNVSRFLRTIILLKHPEKILEIGTGIGYSTISMASVLKGFGGRITTIEFDKKTAEISMNNFKQHGVSNLIKLLVGDAQEIIPKLTDKFDLVFLDVAKNLYPILFNDCIKLLKVGGVLIADDTLFPIIDLDSRWHNLISPIEEFNQLVEASSELESTIIPIGDGITIAVKKLS